MGPLAQVHALLAIDLLLMFNMVGARSSLCAANEQQVLEYAAHLHYVDDTCQLTTTFGIVFHIFPIDFPHCCHTFDDSYHGLYVTNL